MTRLRHALALLAGLPAMAMAQGHPDAQAVVSVGGPITEIIYALGEEDRLVARDTTSLYPAAVNDLPDVGYMRSLSAEGVLSVGPDLIIARSTSGPAEALDQLRSAAVPIVFVEDGFTPEAVVNAVTVVGTALGAEDAASALIATIEAEFATLAAGQTTTQDPIRVLFAISVDGGRLNVAGRETGADGIIALAGGVNVMADDFAGYKLINDEAVILAAPDVVVMMDGRGDHGGRAEEVLGLPSVALTPAGEMGNFITIPGAALGFGPRTPAFAADLRAQFAAMGGGD